ncbi:MAG: response regulator, partial [Sphingomonas sp.]
VGKGTGLGLSMVHGLASQLGGALTIDSRPGHGTRVELWLPESATTATEAVATGPRATVKGHGTALVVDDEDLVRASTADMLGDLGYDVEEARSGEEAMALFRNGGRFDLLVTDHMMPGMTGTELAVTVKQMMPGAAVLVVSGYAASAGVDPELPRLAKPFRIDELAAALGQLGM